MSEFLTLTQRIEVTDFLIAVLGGFSLKVAGRIGSDPGRPGFFERILSLLQSEVQFKEIKLPAGPIEFQASLNQNPTFKEELQRKTRGIVERLVMEARNFVLEAVDRVRKQRNNPDLKVVLIVDSVERLRGVGDSTDVREVFKSAETLFASHSDKLRFTALTTVYTVPPYLQALAGGLGAFYAGGRIYALPSVHIYKSRPDTGSNPVPYDAGLAKMTEIVARRYGKWQELFTDAQMRRLAQHSGGDLRDYFRMVRLALARIPTVKALPVPDAVLADAEDAVRNDMLPIAGDDREWLRKIMDSHETELPSLDALPDFARLQQGKYVLQYRNGKDWYDVHPLLRQEVTA